MAKTPAQIAAEAASAKLAAAAAARKKKVTATPTPAAGPTPTANPSASPRPTGENANITDPVTGGSPDVPKLGASSKWSQFTDGTLVLNSGGMTGGVSTTPYISSGPTVKGAQPKAIVILPSADGTGFVTADLDTVAQTTMTNMGADAIQAYKMFLKNYYASAKAFKTSFSTKDADMAFQEAIKRALTEATLSNFRSGVANAQALAANPNAPLPVALYSFDSYVQSRPTLPEATSVTDTTRSLTTQADALNEFAATTRANVGDISLVDNFAALANAYWIKLHNTELARKSTSTRTTDPITGAATGTGVGYAQMTDADRIAMQLDFITHGDAKAKSTGILNTDSVKLQEAGGLMGQAYTQIIKTANQQGIPLTHQEVVNKVNAAFTRGGSVDNQVAAIGQLAKAHYQNLAPFIDSGLSVGDIASQYQKAKESELELATGSVGVMDSTVQNAIRGDKLPSLNDYIGQVRALPEWRTTKGANESAAGMIDAILKTWGKVG